MTDERTWWRREAPADDPVWERRPTLNFVVSGVFCVLWAALTVVKVTRLDSSSDFFDWALTGFSAAFTVQAGRMAVRARRIARS